MKVLLVQPPLSNCRRPDSNLALAAAALRRSGALVEFVDSGLEFVWWLAEPDQLAATRQRLARLPNGDPNGKWALLAEVAEQRARWALETLKDGERFFDPRDRNAANDVIEIMLRSASASDGHREPVPFGTSSAAALGMKRAMLLARADTGPMAEHFLDGTCQRVRGARADVVTISLARPEQLSFGLTLARRLRASGQFVVLAGDMARELIESNPGASELFVHFADVILREGGWNALVELLGELSGAGSFERVPNIAFGRGGRVLTTVERGEDVARVLTPDFAGLPLDRYLWPRRTLTVPISRPSLSARARAQSSAGWRGSGDLCEPGLIARDLRVLAERFSARAFVLSGRALGSRELALISEAIAPLGGRHVLAARARFDAGMDELTMQCARTAGFRRLCFELELGDRTGQNSSSVEVGVSSDKARQTLSHCRAAELSFRVVCTLTPAELMGPRASHALEFFRDNRQFLELPFNTFDIAVVPTDSALGVGPRDEESGEAEGVARPPLANDLDRHLTELQADFRSPRCRAWPHAVEHALLYAERYETQHDFPFLMSVPSPKSHARFTARWSPALYVRHDAGSVVHLEGLDFRWTAAAAEVNALASERPVTGLTFLERVAQARPAHLPPNATCLPSPQELIADGALQLCGETLPPLPGGQTVDVFRKKQLLRVLCVEEARRRGLEPTRAEVARFVAWFRTRYGLIENASFMDWLAQVDLPEDRFYATLRELLIVEQMENRHRATMRADIIEYIKVFSANDRSFRRGPG